MTERVGLFGWPLGHSVSAPMHNAAFEALGLDWRYELFPIPPENFEAEVTRRIADGCRGFNVTIPHKQAAFRLPQVNEITPAAREIGAANALTVQPDGALKADNTDWRGFARDLQECGVNPRGATCLVLGTGGSARAVIYALRHLGAGTICAVSRHPDGQPAVIGYADLAEWGPRANLIVNCAPVGMRPNVDQSPWPDSAPLPAGSVVYDLVYNPSRTRLMEQAETAGLRAYTGLGMLVWQGAFAFEQWTGQLPPFDVMFDAAQRALEHQ
jgi:shikimate dehydrogenase